MEIRALGIDQGKTVFHLVVLDSSGGLGRDDSPRVLHRGQAEVARHQ